MLILTEHGPECHFKSCRYNLQNHCGLNVKIEDFVVRQKCLLSNDWYITGSFVLDRIFGKTTANDIDLVAPKGEMPAQLPHDVLNSPLRIEMLWVTPEEEAVYQCYNINLPRITTHGLMQGGVGDSISRERLITVLPRRKKLEMLSICIAIKAMVKYDMKPDERTVNLWGKSILSPPKLKKFFAFMFWTLPIESVDWDYVRADYLMNRIGLAYKSSTESQRGQYLEKLKQVLAAMPLDEDVAYRCLMNWLDAVIQGDNEKKKEIEKFVHDRGFKLKNHNRAAP